MLLCRFLEKFPLFPDVQQQEVKLDEVAASLGQLLLLCILFTDYFLSFSAINFNFLVLYEVLSWLVAASPCQLIELHPLRSSCHFSPLVISVLKLRIELIESEVTEVRLVILVLTEDQND